MVEHENAHLTSYHQESGPCVQYTHSDYIYTQLGHTACAHITVNEKHKLVLQLNVVHGELWPNIDACTYSVWV